MGVVCSESWDKEAGSEDTASTHTHDRADMARIERQKLLDNFTEQKDIRERSWRSKIRHLLEPPPLTGPGASHRLAVEDVTLWAQSLDKLLGDKYGKAVFKVFMKSEFCEEYIEFWIACEDFLQIKSLRGLRSRAKRIYDKFIKRDSPKEILLDFQTKEGIRRALPCPSRSCFLAAQGKVYGLMENNSYPRFLRSPLYSRLATLTQEDRRCSRT